VALVAFACSGDASAPAARVRLNAIAASTSQTRPPGERLLLIADMHIPRRARDLPPVVRPTRREAVAGASPPRGRILGMLPTARCASGPFFRSACTCSTTACPRCCASACSSVSGLSVKQA
jgi:hypothetical protein